MVKLSVFSDDLAAGWERAVQVAQDVGVEGLEVRNVWGKSGRDLTDDEARTMARALRGSGLRVSCLGSTIGCATRVIRTKRRSFSSRRSAT